MVYYQPYYTSVQKPSFFTGHVVVKLPLKENVLHEVHFFSFVPTIFSANKVHQPNWESTWNFRNPRSEVNLGRPTPSMGKFHQTEKGTPNFASPGHQIWFLLVPRVTSQTLSERGAPRSGLISFFPRNITVVKKYFYFWT